MNCSVGKMHLLFIVEKVSKMKSCFSWEGTLTMYDGGSMTTSPKIGEYCDSIPPNIITTSSKILVHFHEPYSSSYWIWTIGFKMMYNPTSN